jgi:hypothetical protein
MENKIMEVAEIMEYEHVMLMVGALIVELTKGQRKTLIRDLGLSAQFEVEYRLNPTHFSCIFIKKYID